MTELAILIIVISFCVVASNIDATKNNLYKIADKIF